MNTIKRTIKGEFLLNNTWPLLVILIISIITKNNLLAAAAGVVLILDLMNLHQFYSLLERRGIETGILFLSIALLIPFATGRVTIQDMLKTFSSSVGLFSIIGGLLGAYLNAQGVQFISNKPEIIPGILLGVVISVSFFGGISVGPIMAAGITALLVSLISH